MTKTRALLCPLLSLLLGPAAAQDLGPGAAVRKALEAERRPHEFVVRFRPGADGNARGRVLAGAQVKARSGPNGVRRVRFPQGSDDAVLLARLRSDPAVLSADPNYVRRILVTPDDPSFGQLWGLHNTGGGLLTADADIDAPEAWDVRTDAGTGVVAVMDTGILLTHPDLAANVWVNVLETPGNGTDDDGNSRDDDVNGYDFFNDDSDPTDDESHGSHVAGTIGAVGDNGEGVVGVCWSVKLMALKVFDSDGTGDDFAIIDAFDYAAALKSRAPSGDPNHVNLVAINCSWGGGGFSQTLFDAMKACSDVGILIPCAAGNEQLDNGVIANFPANYDIPNLISVGSTSFNETVSGFSNYGATTVHLMAPGTNILSTVLADGYNYKGGTSMATPHVSGAAALVWAQHPLETAAQIRDRLLYNTDRPAVYANACITRGRLNVHKAISAGPDASAPAALALSVSDPSFSAAGLSWTAPGDDAGAGTAVLYDLRVSTSPINDGNFAAALRKPGVPLPAVAGTVQTFRFHAFQASSTTYYLAMKTIDERGNVSPLSNVVTIATLGTSTRVFEDDFAALDGAKWTTVESPWAVSAGVITESPGGNYLPNLDVELISAPFSLAGKRDSVLSFTHRFRTELGYDYCAVYASDTGGVPTWRLLRVYGGEVDANNDPNVFANSGRIRLDAFDGQPSVQIRFRFLSDSGVNADGWRIDDVAVDAELLAPAAPVANGQAVNVTRNVAKAITLTGSDLNGDALTFDVASNPSNGVLSGTAPNLTYTPNTNYTGADSFTFTASDAALTSTAATVTIAVSAPSGGGGGGGCGLLGAESVLLLGLARLLARRRRR